MHSSILTTFKVYAKINILVETILKILLIFISGVLCPVYSNQAHLPKRPDVMALCGPESRGLIGGGTHNVAPVLMLDEFQTHNTRVVSSPTANQLRTGLDSL